MYNYQTINTMASLWKYMTVRWRRLFAITPEEKYPAVDNSQKEYREEFGGIVDQYLVSYSSERDEKPDGYHRIVYIDADNDIQWRVEKEDTLTEEDQKSRNQAMSKLRIAQSLPVQNLSHEEIVNYKKILGMGYNAALINDWQEVDVAICEAGKYRDDRNKERSRYILLTAATFYVLLFGIVSAIAWHCCGRTDSGMMGMMMGAVGAYVSIWTRYGKMDMTGLGTKSLHYLEAFSRILIGVIFALLVVLMQNSGILFGNIGNVTDITCLLAILGFCAGFSEKWIPSILERFMNESASQEKSPDVKK